MYEVSVSAVALNAGARWGGQSITVTGQGFAIQKDAVSTSDNRVFVGGRRARVIEASYNKIVLETPDLLDTPALGFEHEHIWKKIRHCGLPGKNEIECLGVHLRSCAAALSWGTPADEPKLLAIAPNNMLLALPGSDGLSLDASLVDGDASTMWLSKPGSDTLKLIFDLGVSSSVTHILIRWAGRSTAAEIRVSAGAADPSTCSSETAFLEELVAWRATAAAASDDTDLLETIDLGVFFFSPRVLMVELRGLRVSLVSFGIRDVIIVDKMQLPFPSRQPILVEVGGVEASCGVQHVCSFNYSSAPEVVQVSPTNGTAGILITVNVTGLNVANCAANTVRISNVECAVQSCGGVDGQEGWIMCALGRMSGGTYAVAVTVSGAPAANNGVVFTYPVLISAVTPAAGGYGGAYTITVTGDGFHTDARRISAMLCGFPCKVTKADMTSLECVPEALFDSRQAPGIRALISQSQMAVTMLLRILRVRPLCLIVACLVAICSPGGMSGQPGWSICALVLSTLHRVCALLLHGCRFARPTHPVKRTPKSAYGLRLLTTLKPLILPCAVALEPELEAKATKTGSQGRNGVGWQKAKSPPTSAISLTMCLRGQVGALAMRLPSCCSSAHVSQATACRKRLAT